MEYIFTRNGEVHLKNGEFQELVAAAAAVQVPLIRVQKREPQPDGTIRLHGGGFDLSPQETKLLEQHLEKSTRAVWRAHPR